MANYKMNTQISRGKHKGKKVSELVRCPEGIKYLKVLHENPKYNVKMTNDVLKALN